ncbi:hypothetical protein SPI_04599 [Niveomyces insectorum RCEF 264]|uniref:Cerato-platanin n=1 Tax=Niveomyces insectorum RCEF 264 TaxID=1081102 RepID=A0A167UNB2_9HYPO|nr:hypothetical protein SPI_04599 [Niveomyces insectorum RCEF 264]
MHHQLNTVPRAALVALLAARTAVAASGSVSATPHDSYSSSVGVLGCKINTNRVAYWPAPVDCTNICVRLSYGDRSVYLLRIDQSGGAHDVSYDAWNYLQTGSSATADPVDGGGVAMDYEDVDASFCADLLHTPGSKLPLSASNSMDFVASCLGDASSWVAQNHILYNVCDPLCSLGFDEPCTLDLATSNQPSCPHTLGLTTPMSPAAPVYNIQYPSGKAVDAVTGRCCGQRTGCRARGRRARRAARRPQQQHQQHHDRDHLCDHHEHHHVYAATLTWHLCPDQPVQPGNSVLFFFSCLVLLTLPVAAAAVVVVDNTRGGQQQQPRGLEPHGGCGGCVDRLAAGQLFFVPVVAVVLVGAVPIVFVVVVVAVLPVFAPVLPVSVLVPVLVPVLVLVPDRVADFCQAFVKQLGQQCKQFRRTVVVVVVVGCGGGGVVVIGNHGVGRHHACRGEVVAVCPVDPRHREHRRHRVGCAGRAQGQRRRLALDCDRVRCHPRCCCRRKPRSAGPRGCVDRLGAVAVGKTLFESYNNNDP